MFTHVFVVLPEFNFSDVLTESLIIVMTTCY